MKKIILFLMLTISILLVGCSLYPNSEWTFKYEEKEDNTYEITKAIEGIRSDIIIPETYEGKAVTSIGPYAFKYTEPLIYPTDVNPNELFRMTIPNTITEIKEGAFKNLPLGEIEIPSSVIKIEKNAFEGCEGVKIYAEAESMPINWSAEFNSENRPIIFGCVERKSNDLFNYIVMSDDTICITSVKLDTPNLGTQSVVFPDTIEDKEVSRIAGNVFPYGPWAIYAPYIKTVTLPKNIKVLEENVFNHIDLMNIILPNGLTKIEKNVFNTFNDLASIAIPASVTEIGENAFNSNTQIYCEVESKPVGWHDNWCSNEEMVVFGVTKKDVTIDGFEYYISSIEELETAIISKYNGELDNVIIPNFIEEATVYMIAKDAFKECVDLKNVSLPASINIIGNKAFYNCRSLESLILPIEVKNIGEGAFENCSSLTNITIPEGITKINDSIFRNCNNLISITIPESITSIGHNAFGNCSRLTSIEISASVTSIGEGAFENCSSLTSITIPEGITSIESSTFNHCISLRSIVIPASVTSIGERALRDCTNLESIVIPIGVANIGERAFRNCTRLTINCEKESIPSGWHDDWNPDNRPVIWGYTED